MGSSGGVAQALGPEDHLVLVGPLWIQILAATHLAQLLQVREARHLPRCEVLAVLIHQHLVQLHGLHHDIIEDLQVLVLQGVHRLVLLHGDGSTVVHAKGASPPPGPAVSSTVLPGVHHGVRHAVAQVCEEADDLVGVARPTVFVDKLDGSDVFQEYPSGLH